MSATPRASDIKDDVGRRLRAARSIVYDSSNLCARALGLPHQTWRNYEKGERYPDPFHLVRFCDATGFTLDFIYRGRLRGIAEDVQIRLAADYPELVDEAPDVGHSAKAVVPA
jgi:transcriptional regulator with XRE-family HTH domain